MRWCFRGAPIWVISVNLMTSISIATCIQRASELAIVSDTPRLDVEILLAHLLNKDRTWLFTWPEAELTAVQTEQFELNFRRRLSGEPVAHIIGQREFWSLPLFVDKSTLIPRPDTELIVATVMDLFAQDLPEQRRDLLDLGTGTGAIVLALASEKKYWQCMGVDKESAAVALAEKNRAHLQFHHVTIKQSDWFSALAHTTYDVIVSNPPYIDPADPHLTQGDVRFEPLSALIANNHGLADIEFIVQHAWDYLLPEGWLLVEHGYDQGAAVRKLFLARGYQEIKTSNDMGNNERVTCGRKGA